MSLFDEAAKNPAGHRDVVPPQLDPVPPGVRLIDVRESNELVGPLGHIAGVEHVPMAQVGAAAEGWDRGEALVFVCRSGARSGHVAAALTGAGFTRAMNLVGGMLAWNDAGLPVVRSGR